MEMLLLVSKKQTAKLLLTWLHPPRDVWVGQRRSGAAWDARGLGRDLLRVLCRIAFPLVTSLLAQQQPSHLTGREVLLMPLKFVTGSVCPIANPNQNRSLWNLGKLLKL